MKKEKTRSDVQGAVMGCINFSSCPLCYGCRAYDSSRMECMICSEHKKFNICNTSKHQAKPVSQLITRNKINL